MSGEIRFDSFEKLVEGRIRGNQLMLSGMGLTAEEATLLWESPKLSEISWLDLEDNLLGDSGVEALSQSPYVNNVQYLSLTRNQITDKGLAHLAQSVPLEKLKRLHLKENSIQGEGIVALFESQTLHGLQTFHINDGWTCKKRDGWRYNPQG